MISLNAKRVTPKEGESTSTEEFLIPYNSPLHRFLENSLLPYKWHLDINLRNIIAAHEKWRSSYKEAGIPVIRIVFLHGKCITAKRQLAQNNLRHMKEKEHMKLAHLQHLLKPYIQNFRASLEGLQKAIVEVQEAHKQVVDMMPVPGLAEIVFYHKRNVRYYVNFIGKVLKAYKWELRMRRFVEERITNTMNREELHSCRSLWQGLHETAEITEYKKEYKKFHKEINPKDELEYVVNSSEEEKDDIDEEKSNADDEPAEVNEKEK